MPCQDSYDRGFPDKLIGWFNRPPGVALTTGLALTGALTKFLEHNRYPVFTPEIGLIVLLIAVSSMAVGFAYKNMAWLARGLAILSLTTMLLFLVMFIDDTRPQYLSVDLLIFALFSVLLATGIAAVYRFSTKPLGRNLLIIFVGMVFVELITTSPWTGLAVPAAYLITRRHFVPIMAIFAAVFLVTNPFVGRIESAAPSPNISGLAGTATDAGPAAATAPQDRPFILHLILDEHLGIEGFNALAIDPLPITTDLLDFYGRHRFQVFAGAYSKHIHTKNALPEILRLGADPADPKTDISGEAADQYGYFREFASREYPLTVLQPGGFPYCRAGDFTACRNYAATGPLPLRQSEMPSLEKAKFILSEFLSLSPTVLLLTRIYDYAAFVLRGKAIPVPLLSISNRSSNPTMQGAQILEQVASELTQAKPGTAYFAHIVFPHYPYLYSADCKLKAFKDWRYPSQGNMHGPIAVRQSAYVAQIRCGLRYLEKLLDVLNQSAVADNYVVIIQGDHGSRIVDTYPSAGTIGRFSDHDLISGFSTLFAVKFSDAVSGYVPNHISVDKLLKNLVENNFLAINPDAIEAGPITVILDDDDWVPTVEYDLPKAWPAPIESEN